MFDPLMGDLVAGIDEVGRGCLSGPIVAAATLFRYTEEPPIAGLRDSKKFSSETQRQSVASRILASPSLLHYCIGIVDVNDINLDGIEPANHLVFQRALAGLSPQPKWIFVDGVKPVQGFPREQQLVEPQADGKYWMVSAASILAKVHRDNLMNLLAKDFPHYDWKSNKGYGTPKHIAGLIEHGPCVHHREKFISNYIKK